MIYKSLGFIIETRINTVDIRRRLICFILFAISTLLLGCTKAKKFKLEVHAIHLLDDSSVTGATVEVFLLDSRDQPIARQSLDDTGVAFFHLKPGNYVIQMASGYIGEKKIILRDDLITYLEVIKVLR